MQGVTKNFLNKIMLGVTKKVGGTVGRGQRVTEKKKQYVNLKHDSLSVCSEIYRF